MSTATLPGGLRVSDADRPPETGSSGAVTAATGANAASGLVSTGLFRHGHLPVGAVAVLVVALAGLISGSPAVVVLLPVLVVILILRRPARRRRL